MRNPEPEESATLSSTKQPLPVFFAYLGYIVFSLALAAVAVEALSFAVLSVHRLLHPDKVLEASADNPAYSGFVWAKSCLAEQEQRLKARNAYVPFRLWGVSEWHSGCMNNDSADVGTVRRTVNAADPRCADQSKTRVWIMGGSAVYGTGIPDWATLPSYLSQDLNRNGGCWDVKNLGVEGYATTQEIIYLIQQLRAGRHPDVVILYDGANDSILGTTYPAGSVPHMNFEEIRSRYQGSVSGRLDFLRRSNTWQLALALNHRVRGSSVTAVTDLDARVSLTLDNYEENLRIAQALGTAYGFKVRAFWQPVLMYGHKPLVPYERQLLSLSPRFSFQNLVPACEEASRRADRSGNFVFLGNIFDHTSEPVYLDWVHLNPAGNALAATYVARTLLSAVSTGAKSFP